MGALFALTFATNFLGLVFSLWLGIYLVTRNPKRLVAWLMTLTLWCVAGFFLNVLLAINPPPKGPFLPGWLYLLFPFWPAEAVQGTSNRWLQGWSILPGIAFCHHASVLLRPGRLTAWRWARILAGYALAIGAVVVQSNAGILFISAGGDPLYLNSLRPGPWYLFFAAMLVLLLFSIAFNMLGTAADIPAAFSRKRMLALVGTILIAGLSEPLLLAGAVFQITTPIYLLSLVILIPVGLIGYAVARYSAFMEGRTVWRDFGYNLFLLGGIVLLYLLISWLLIKTYQAPAILLVFIPFVAVITHSLMSSAFRLLDYIFYPSGTRQLRFSLRQLQRHVSEGKETEESLQEALRSLCGSCDACWGLIFTFEGGAAHKAAQFNGPDSKFALEPSDLSADDVLYLAVEKIRPPLDEAALLIPLYAEGEQIGALVLGRPFNGIQYAPEDVEGLLEQSDGIADILYIARLKANYMKQMVELAESQRRPAGKAAVTVPVAAVEAALRNLYDYSFLADSPLASLEIVRLRLPAGENTHLERGKALHQLLLEVLEKLCPRPSLPRETVSRDPPPREWHPYLILRDAYRGEKPNREIMSALYISEGTFNRTRRSAIRAVARALGEMEIQT